jgi:hypothetical protein
LEGVPGPDDDEGMMRLFVLTEGVTQGVLSADELVAERVLSLLRERLEDVGDSGTCAEAIDAASSGLIKPPLTLTLRLRARSLCSLKKLLVEVVVRAPRGDEASRLDGD